jgi:hypothetical protein
MARGESRAEPMTDRRLTLHFTDGIKGATLTG